MWKTWAIPSAVNKVQKENFNNLNILTNEQVESWREKGFALVDGLLSDKLVNQVFDESMEILAPMLDSCDFGSGGKLEFPCGMKACDEVTLHPLLMAAAAQLLNVPILSLRLCQSDIWIKRGKDNIENDPMSNNSQRIHCDYGNNTLVHPPSWETPEAVAMIIYYSNVEESGGPTALVPRKGSDDEAYQWPIVALPGIGGLPFINDRNGAENWMKENRPDLFTFRQKLYEREVPVKYKKGTVLLYRHDVFHRGTPVKKDKFRVIQNLAFRKKEVEWITTWNEGFARKMYATGEKCTSEYIIGKSTVEQRTVLGFPPPGHYYWNEVTLNAVNLRYKPFGFDKKPYEDALIKK